MTTAAHQKAARRWTVPAALHSAPLWLAWLLPVFAWAPLTYPGYFEVHSGFTPIFNLTDLAHHLMSFAWAPVVGQPYDLLRGERALPYLLALLPRTLGTSGATAIKLVMGASILAGALGVFGWTRRRFGEWPALLAAFVYALWPLGLATVYVRGAFAEAFLLGLLPFVWWAVENLTLHHSGAPKTPPSFFGREAGGIGALALALAAAVWTQTGAALWLAAVVLAYLLIVATKGRGRTFALWGWLAGMGLGLAGLLPLALQRGLGGGTWPVFIEHLVYPHQLLLANWGHGPSVPGPNDTLTFQLGLVACGLAVLGIILWAQRRGATPASDEQTAISRRTVLFAGVLVLMLALLATTLAAPFWRLLPFLGRTLAYPWQLLLLAGPWLAWLAGLGGRMLLDLLPVSSGESPEKLASATPLFAALLGVALLGSYAMLNPTTVDVQPPEQPLAVFGDHEIALVQAQPFGLIDSTGTITATVTWQALRPLDHDYTVFFQAIGPDGKLWGQQDTMPQGDKLPTSQWRPGQVVEDNYQITLKSGAPHTGKYQALLGFYLLQTGERLHTAAGNNAGGIDDKVVLTAP
jgi:hypothetical protein